MEKKQQTQHLCCLYRARFRSDGVLARAPGAVLGGAQLARPAPVEARMGGIKGIKGLSQACSRVGRSKGVCVYLKDTDQIIID